MREGQLALGVWLPLAFADLLGWTISMATMNQSTPGRAEILDSWGLQHLASAVRDEDLRAEDARLVAGFNRIAKRFGAKPSS